MQHTAKTLIDDDRDADDRGSGEDRSAAGDRGEQIAAHGDEAGAEERDGDRRHREHVGRGSRGEKAAEKDGGECFAEDPGERGGEEGLADEEALGEGDEGLVEALVPRRTARSAPTVSS